MTVFLRPIAPRRFVSRPRNVTRITPDVTAVTFARDSADLPPFVQALLDALEDAVAGLANWLRRILRPADADDDAIVTILRKGNQDATEAVLALLGATDRLAADGAIATELAKRLQKVVATGITIAAQADARLKLILDLHNPNDLAVAYARARAGQLITEMTDVTTIRQIVTRAVEGQYDVRGAARLIREVIGLHSRQAATVLAYHDALLAQGMAPEQAAAKAAKKAGQLLRSRAETIARTEIMGALNAGQHALWSAGVDDGLIVAATASRVWMTVPEILGPCPICKPLNGVAVPFDQPFQTAKGPLMHPPAHPRCRCTARLEFADAAPATFHTPGGKGHNQKRHGHRSKGGVMSRKTDDGSWEPVDGKKAGKTKKEQHAGLFGGDVSLHTYGDKKDIATLEQSIFGKAMTGADYAELIGIPTGAVVTIEPIGGKLRVKSVLAEGDMRVVQLRSLSKGKGGPEMYNDLMMVHNGPPGMGTAIFARQVDGARKHGVASIKTEAAGYGEAHFEDMGGESPYNGYYTWPRLGYQPQYDQPDVDHIVGQSGLGKSLSDLMATKEGRAYWKTNGMTFDGVFDTDPASYSSQVLDAYLKETASLTAAERNRLSVNIDKDGLPLTPAEDAALDRVLDRLGRKRADEPVAFHLHGKHDQKKHGHGAGLRGPLQDAPTGPLPHGGGGIDEAYLKTLTVSKMGKPDLQQALLQAGYDQATIGPLYDRELKELVWHHQGKAPKKIGKKTPPAKAKPNSLTHVNRDSNQAARKLLYPGDKPAKSSYDHELLARKTKTDVMVSLAKRLESDADFMALAKTNVAYDGYGKTLAEGTVSGLIHSWAGTSADSKPLPLALQMAVKDEFKLSDVYDPGLGIHGSAPLYDKHGAGLRAFVRAQHSYTQEKLKAAGITEVTLVRGMNGVSKPKTPTASKTQLQPASSFSASVTEAKNFGSTLFVSTVPASQILGCPQSGWGCLSEQEFVVFGGTLDAVAMSGNTPDVWSAAEKAWKGTP